LPLHCAFSEKVRSYMSFMALQTLVQAWPDAICQQDDEGMLPLHYACKRDVEVQLIQFLIDCWPESLHITAKDGTLPLHQACMSQIPAVICCLIKSYPQAVHEKDIKLQLPLHIVCSGHAPLDWK